MRTGRFGPYVQLGEVTDDGPKPKTTSLFAGMDPETVTFEEAQKLLSQPVVVGVTEDGTEITAQNGRFGPYLKAGDETRSLQEEEQIFTITEAEARRILKEPKKGRRRGPQVLKELGEHPDSTNPVRVLSGRYGPYVSDGELNASLPKGRTPEDVDLDEAVHLLKEREARGGKRKKKSGAKKKAKKKASTKKSSKKKASTKKKASGGKKKSPTKKKASGPEQSSKPPTDGKNSDGS